MSILFNIATQGGIHVSKRFLALDFRSTPCPNVKHGDDWGDPTQCESGDNCAYCHTRTEQQFHPEVSLGFILSQFNWTAFPPRGKSEFYIKPAYC